MKLAILAVLMLFLVGTSFALTEHNQNDIVVSAYEDTFFPTVQNGGAITSCGQDANQSVIHGNETYVQYSCGTGGTSFRSLFRYNLSTVLDYLIRNGTLWNMNHLDSICSALSFTLSPSIDTWGEMDLFSSDTISLIDGIPISGLTGLSGTNSYNFTSSAAAINALYNLSGDIRSFKLTPAGQCSGTGTKGVISSVQGGTPAWFTFHTIDFYTGTIQGTDISVIYFDFESNASSTADFPEADVVINADENSLQALHGATSTFINSLNDPTNTLDNLACKGATGYTTSKTYGWGAGQPFTSDNDVGCIYLGNNHDGRAFYGAIKIINVTNVRSGASKDLDFYVAAYSPVYSVISDMDLSPNPIQTRRNVTFTWLSSTALTSNIKFRVTDVNTHVSTGYTTIEGNASQFTTTHTLVANGNNFELSGASLIYEFQAYGTDAYGNTIYSDLFNATAIQYDVALDDITTGIVFLLQNEYGDGINGECRIDNYLASSTTEVFGSERACIMLGFGLGSHNFTITSPNYITKKFSLIITTDPYIQAVRMTPTNCLKTIVATTQQQCETDVLQRLNDMLTNGVNSTSWYCQLDLTECAVYTAGNMSCERYGMYSGYVCFDGYHPAGFPVNTTVPSGQTPANQTGSINDALGSGLGGIFGVSGSAGLNFLALLIALIITVAVGITTRNGLIAEILRKYNEWLWRGIA